MALTLLRHGRVHNPADRNAQALAVRDGLVVWVGSDLASEHFVGTAETVVDLRGAWVAPAFVDSHVHHTETGLSLIGVDFGDVGGAPELLARVRDAGRGGAIVGHGWDESKWSLGAIPDRALLDQACGGQPLYLSRVDVHSALVSSALVAAIPEIAGLPGYHPTGPISGAAHTAVRRHLADWMPKELRQRAIRAVRAHASSQGIAAMHEAAGPSISGAADLMALRELCAVEAGPQLVAYWGSTDLEQVRELGAAGAAGDLCVDGSLGSRTALLSKPYWDGTQSEHGRTYLSATEVAEHLVACTESGIQGGFHAIGDAAMDLVVAGLRTALDRCGTAAVQAARHRVEHACMCQPEHAAVLARSGVIASVQPQFDAHWGGPGGMYEARLGPARTQQCHDLAGMMRAGVTLALGSDAPVTPLAPWEAVRAAIWTHNPGHRISPSGAFDAATRGGWRAARIDDAGSLTPGAPATFAIWEVLDWDADDIGETLAQRSSLPLLTPGTPAPRCLATVLSGQVIHTVDPDWLPPNPMTANPSAQYLAGLAAGEHVGGAWLPPVPDRVAVGSGAPRDQLR